MSERLTRERIEALLIAELRELRGIAEAARELAANVDEEDYKPGFYKRGNLGHCHDNPPQWDSKRQGTCERCALWMQLLSRLAAWDARKGDR